MELKGYMMKFFKVALPVLLVSSGLFAQAQEKHSWKAASSAGYDYRYVSSDPLKARFYTLKNGLTVILSQNNKEPNIVFRMAVRAGSNTDPANSTGLAHYLEHLLFKGTDRFGTLDYGKEKPLLDKITSLYETYRQTADETRRQAIYKEIDAVSRAASRYAIANEYDKLMKTIGSSSTNAYTSSEKTVYIEDLPSNAVDKFIAVQAERFRSPVFRMFHTELEAVYEEKNRGLDDDRSKMYETMMAALFPTHNYGRQTTIGTIEHLKNPSLVEIKAYYEKYYVPNNMAIIMAGDFDYDDLIRKIDEAFRYMESKTFTPYAPAPEAAILRSKSIDISGPGAEALHVGYRGGAQNTYESMLLNLISSILANGKAGLIDVNIAQQQKMMGAGASYYQKKDYGMFVLTGAPKEGQTLQQVKDLLLSQIDLLKRGDFDEGLIAATVANMKLSELQDFESNDIRADNLVEAFVMNKGQEWEKMLSGTDLMSKVTKREIVAFSNRFFADNYVAVFKHKGAHEGMTKISKPEITAVQTNANEVSPFAKRIADAPVKPIAAKFLDYKRDLSFSKAGAAEVISVKNTENELFRMTYHFNMGAHHNKLLPYAVEYLAFLGTDKYSSEEINRLFYNMACSYSVMVSKEKTSISIGGLQENFDQAVALLENLLSNCKVDEQALANLKSLDLKSRENAKLKKDLIMAGLMDYAQYGEDNPFNYVITNDEIRELKAEDLVGLLHGLNQYEHIITYYGPNSSALFSKEIAGLHHLPRKFRDAPAVKKFTYSPLAAPKVYFANYDMVQTEIAWIRNIEAYNPEKAATITTFNNYFGDGMGSLVSQTIRESKALAYSTYAMVWTPDSREKQAYTIAYVGSQADKMNDAITAMNELISDLPVSESGFALSKASVINRLETSRITNDGIIRAYFADKKLGYASDSRKAQYETMQSLTLDEIRNFHKQKLSGRPYNYCVLGAEKNVNHNTLKKYGEVNELTLEQIFGY